MEKMNAKIPPRIMPLLNINAEMPCIPKSLKA
jgi:hypothetical protein